jgi:DNA-directed RNA polymerase specialized sigma24 family protein
LVAGGIVVGVEHSTVEVEVHASHVGPLSKDAFEAFYRRERQSAVRLAWLLTHDRAASEDLAQEAFTAVYRRFESLERPAAYLRKTVVNAVCQRARTAGREQRRLRLVAPGVVTEIEGPTGGVVDAVAALPATQRTAVVLRYWAGLTDREIAEAMAVRPGTVRSLLARATSRLRRELI